jgi:hypothetical protein
VKQLVKDFGDPGNAYEATVFKKEQFRTTARAQKTQKISVKRIGSRTLGFMKEMMATRARK